jgi:precorrin-2 methylase
MKAYRNVQDIISAVDEAESFHDCVGITKCGLPEEEIVTDLKAFAVKPPNYWTLIIAKQKQKVKELKVKLLLEQHHGRDTDAMLELADTI